MWFVTSFVADGCGVQMRFVSVTGDGRVLDAVQLLLRGTHIGEGGRDQGRVVERYARLEAVHLWRIDNPMLQEQYTLQVASCSPPQI
jgi:hypothetical protein